METLRFALVVLAAALCAALTPVGSPRPALACTCALTFNNFPQGSSEGTLSESLACLPSGTNECQVTGNITWTPSIDCYNPPNPGGTWSNATSFSEETCTGTNAYFSNCTGATANAHQCSWSCQEAGTRLRAFLGFVYTYTGGGLATGAKEWRCN